MDAEKSRQLAVGCRELKTRLGTYMRRVKAGKTIIVTERRQPIGELRPLAPSNSLHAKLRWLAAAGLVTQKIRKRGPLPEFRPICPATSTPSLSQAVIEDREDRF